MDFTSDYLIREFQEADRAGVTALGSHIVDWWHKDGPDVSLHVVAEAVPSGEILGHAQVRDRGVPGPSRRAGQCHSSIVVAAGHRRRGIGSALYDRIEGFAVHRGARQLWTAYVESADAPAGPFLKSRGFERVERYFASTCDLRTFDAKDFANAIERVKVQGIELTTYAHLKDSPAVRKQLYELEEAARAVQPFREVGPYLPTSYEKWEAEFSGRDPTAIFIAREPAPREFVGVVTGLEWYFTGVNPAWTGRGIATALKVLCMQEAKARGIESMDTENHQDNVGMLKINRRLGFVQTGTEVASVKRL